MWKFLLCIPIAPAEPLAVFEVNSQLTMLQFSMRLALLPTPPPFRPAQFLTNSELVILVLFALMNTAPAAPVFILLGFIVARLPSKYESVIVLPAPATQTAPPLAPSAVLLMNLQLSICTTPLAHIDPPWLSALALINVIPFKVTVAPSVMMNTLD